MSHLDHALANPLDRLGVLLEHALGMATAMTCEGYDDLNAGAKRCLANALMTTIIDASRAHTSMAQQSARGQG